MFESHIDVDTYSTRTSHYPKSRNSLLSSPTSLGGRCDCPGDCCNGREFGELFSSRSKDVGELLSCSSKDGSCSSPRPNSSSFPSSCASQTRPSSCRATCCTCPSCSSRARCSSCSSAMPSPPPLEYDGAEEPEPPVCQWCRAEQAEETREIIIDHSSIVVRNT